MLNVDYGSPNEVHVGRVVGGCKCIAITDKDGVFVEVLAFKGRRRSQLSNGLVDVVELFFLNHVKDGEPFEVAPVSFADDKGLKAWLEHKNVRELVTKSQQPPVLKEASDLY